MSRNDSDKMRGVVLLGNRVAEVRELPVPDPKPREVRFRVRVAGICGSDLHFYRSTPEELGIRRGIVIGHEPSGVVDAVGEGVRDFRIRDRVTVNHTIGCGHCEYCLSGETVLCKENLGMAARGRGGDAHYVVMPEMNCHRLADELSFDEGAFIACTGATAYGALRKLDPSGRDNLVVWGLGPVGLSAVIIGRALGARVIGVDINPRRLDFATSLGASETVNAKRDDPVEAILSLIWGRGAEVAIETSGSPAARSDAAESVCVKGRVVYVGLGRSEKSISAESMIHREVLLMGSKVLPISLCAEMMRFMVETGIRFESIVTHRVGLDEAPEAFSLFDEGAEGKFVITLD